MLELLVEQPRSLNTGISSFRTNKRGKKYTIGTSAGLIPVSYLLPIRLSSLIPLNSDNVKVVPVLVLMRLVRAKESRLWGEQVDGRPELGVIRMERVLVDGHSPRGLVVVHSSNNSKLLISPVNTPFSDVREEANDRIQLVAWWTSSSQLHLGE